MYGKIKLQWKLTDDLFKLDITIPHNTKATVLLPYAKLDKLLGNNITSEKEILYTKAKENNNGVELELGSGTYSFCYNITFSTWGQDA